MVGLKDAISNSAQYAESIYNGIMNIRVEEVDSSDDEEYKITLGWDDIFKVPSVVGALTKPKRVYKVFFVDKQTGEVTKMKIRELKYD